MTSVYLFPECVWGGKQRKYVCWVLQLMHNLFLKHICFFSAPGLMKPTWAFISTSKMMWLTSCPPPRNSPLLVGLWTPRDTKWKLLLFFKTPENLPLCLSMARGDLGSLITFFQVQWFLEKLLGVKGIWAIQRGFDSLLGYFHKLDSAGLINSSKAGQKPPFFGSRLCFLLPKAVMLTAFVMAPSGLCT